MISKSAIFRFYFCYTLHISRQNLTRYLRDFQKSYILIVQLEVKLSFRNDRKHNLKGMFKLCPAVKKQFSNCCFNEKSRMQKCIRPDTEMFLAVNLIIKIITLES